MWFILKEQAAGIDEKMDMLDDLVQTVDRSCAHLTMGSLDEWGHELDRTWSIKKQFAGGISNPAIDAMYEAAKGAGALGGKVLGAGGGGFLLLYVPEGNQAAVRSALSAYREVSFTFEPEGSHIIFSD